MYMCVLCAHMMLIEGTWFHVNGIKKDCKYSCEGWKPNLGSLQEKQPFLATKSSFQPPRCFLLWSEESPQTVN